MERKRKSPRWMIILLIFTIVFAITAWWNSTSYGIIDISESIPSEAMMLHIGNHIDELLSREDLFTPLTGPDGILDGIRYIGSDSIEIACLYLDDENDNYEYIAHYKRQPDPDFFHIRHPWSGVGNHFIITADGIALAISDYDTESPSDAPLREMMSAVESVIGTP